MANKLDVQKIVDEAILLMREGLGLESLSLRKLAARLDARAPSLYRHVESKDALFSLMSASIFQSCLDRMPPCASWQDWLREFGLSLWTEQHSTPDILQLIAYNRDRHAGRPSVHERVVGALLDLGLPRDRAVSAQWSVQALVTGWTMMFPVSRADDEAAFRASLATLIAGWEAQARA